MTETRSRFKERLKQEGKWDEFLRIREQYKSQGYAPKEAYSLAACQVADQQGNVPVSGTDVGGDVDRDIFAGKEQVSERQEVRWVFDNIGVANLKPEDAPSSGAWSYLQSVRSSPVLLQDFYRNVWPKIFPNKTEIENARKFEDDGREQLDFIEQIRRASQDAVL